jgi:hypothetical protein
LIGPGTSETILITEANLPKTVEQQTLAVLLRIEEVQQKILDALLGEEAIDPELKGVDLTDVIHHIEPTKTPFMASAEKNSTSGYTSDRVFDGVRPVNRKIKKT